MSPPRHPRCLTKQPKLQSPSRAARRNQMLSLQLRFRQLQVAQSLRDRGRLADVAAVEVVVDLVRALRAQLPTPSPPPRYRQMNRRQNRPRSKQRQP